MSTKVNFRGDAFKDIALAIGHMTLAWNDLHQALGDLFWMVLRIPNSMIPLAIWHSSKADRSQREMLEVLAKLRVLGHELSDEARKEILWILCETLKLENTRNNVIHTPLREIDGEITVSAHHYGHQRAKQLVDKDALQECRLFYDAVIVLRDYTRDLSDKLQGHGQPLPGRPKLPSRGQSN